MRSVAIADIDTVKFFPRSVSEAVLWWLHGRYPFSGIWKLPPLEVPRTWISNILLVLGTAGKRGYEIEILSPAADGRVSVADWLCVDELPAAIIDFPTKQMSAREYRKAVLVREIKFLRFSMFSYVLLGAIPIFAMVRPTSHWLVTKLALERCDVACQATAEKMTSGLIVLGAVIGTGVFALPVACVMSRRISSVKHRRSLFFEATIIAAVVGFSVFSSKVSIRHIFELVRNFYLAHLA